MGIGVGRADKKNNTRAIGGFTLLELMLAVMIAAIVIGFGSPAFQDFRRNAQLTRDANELLTSVQRARSEAAKRQRAVSLCVTADPTAAEPECSGDPLTASPATGWLLFEDGDGDCERAADEPVLIQRAPFERLALAASAERTCISFAANGFLRDDGGSREVYDVLFCDPAHGDAALRALRLSPSGHVRVTRDPNEISDLELTCPSA